VDDVFVLERGTWRRETCDSWYAYSSGEGERRFEPTGSPPFDDKLLTEIAVAVYRAAPWLAFVAVGPAIEGHPNRIGEYLPETRAVLVTTKADIMWVLWHEIYHAVDFERLTRDDRQIIARWLGFDLAAISTVAEAHTLQEDAARAFQDWMVVGLDDVDDEVLAIWEQVRAGYGARQQRRDSSATALCESPEVPR
jgi:hypothetical protein